jgi:hypothetical protein
MNRKEQKHCAIEEKVAWEEVFSIAKLRLRRIEEAEVKYKINKQKARITNNKPLRFRRIRLNKVE